MKVKLKNDEFTQIFDPDEYKKLLGIITKLGGKQINSARHLGNSKTEFQKLIPRHERNGCDVDQSKGSCAGLLACLNKSHRNHFSVIRQFWLKIENVIVVGCGVILTDRFANEPVLPCR